MNWYQRRSKQDKQGKLAVMIGEGKFSEMGAASVAAVTAAAVAVAPAIATGGAAGGGGGTKKEPISPGSDQFEESSSMGKHTTGTNVDSRSGTTSPTKIPTERSLLIPQAARSERSNDHHKEPTHTGMVMETVQEIPLQQLKRDGAEPAAAARVMGINSSQSFDYIQPPQMRSKIPPTGSSYYLSPSASTPSNTAGIADYLYVNDTQLTADGVPAPQPPIQPHRLHNESGGQARGNQRFRSKQGTVPYTNL